jgi:hypothetical protein
MPQVILMRYASRSPDARLAVGDVVRCADFQWGFRPLDPARPLIVAWLEAWRPRPEDPPERWGGTAAHDASRGQALFLITSITLRHDETPDDVEPGNHWLARSVHATRLADDLTFGDDSERIAFMMNDRMSVTKTTEDRMEVVGYADMPIMWFVPPVDP